MQQGRFIFIYLGLCLILSACGGGGASPSSTILPSSPSAASLPRPNSVYISEISFNSKDGLGAWIEIYNSGSLDIFLNGYSVRVAGLVQYDIPRDIQLKAGSYLLFSGKRDRSQLNTDQMVYFDFFSDISLSGANTALELVKDGVTQDFVRFGDSKAIPLSAGIAWGNNVLIQPSYGQSLVR
ncbi:MAG: lamin tail domain-containing protein, partial [Burkholderiales bacterium]|nr:lamin tail domain-containing protein [Burkholderiales bacterium]